MRPSVQRNRQIFCLALREGRVHDGAGYEREHLGEVENTLPGGIDGGRKSEHGGAADGGAEQHADSEPEPSVFFTSAAMSAKIQPRKTKQSAITADSSGRRLPLLNIFSKPLSGVARRTAIYAALTPTQSTKANAAKAAESFFAFREPLNASRIEAQRRTRKTAAVISEKKNEKAK